MSLSAFAADLTSQTLREIEESVQVEAYTVEEDGTKVPVEVETSIRLVSQARSVDGNMEPVYALDASARISNEHYGDSTYNSIGAEAYGTIYFTRGNRLSFQAISGGWDAPGCTVSSRVVRASRTGKTHAYKPNSNGFYESIRDETPSNQLSLYTKASICDNTTGYTEPLVLSFSVQ